MDKQHIDEVLVYLENERRVVAYFKDRYAVDALKRFVGAGKTVSAVKQSRFAGLLNKPWIKAQLATLGNPVLSAELLNYWWRDEVFYFDLTLDKWGGQSRSWQQTTRSGYNLVLQLNFTQSHNRDYKRLPDNYGLSCWPGHPTYTGNKRYTMAWARIDLSEDLSDALIEEIQTDWLRDAKYSLRRAKRPLLQGKVLSTQAKQKNQHFECYFTRHIKPVMAIWDEAVLNTTLNFLFDSVGVKNVYYHDFATGAQLKKIAYTLPPKSLYSKLPKQFGFMRQQVLPAFLAKHRQVNKTWKKCQNPAIYHMANNTQQS